MNKRLLIADHDTALQGSLVTQFELQDEFAVTTAGTAREVMQLVTDERFDLLILEVGLPDADGCEVCKLLRRKGFRNPVIILSAQASDADMIRGLDAGANDYISKPTRFAVLLARIRTHLRQYEQSEDATFSIGPYLFQPARRALISAGGSRVPLTDKETGILRYLHRVGGRPVARQELLEQVWSYRSGVTTHTLETHIYRLRQKIERDTSMPRLIVHEGGGYKLVLQSETEATSAA